MELADIIYECTEASGYHISNRSAYELAKGLISSCRYYSEAIGNLDLEYQEKIRAADRLILEHTNGIIGDFEEDDAEEILLNDLAEALILLSEHPGKSLDRIIRLVRALEEISE